MRCWPSPSVAVAGQVRQLGDEDLALLAEGAGHQRDQVALGGVAWPSSRRCRSSRRRGARARAAAAAGGPAGSRSSTPSAAPSTAASASASTRLLGVDGQPLAGLGRRGQRGVGHAATLRPGSGRAGSVARARVPARARHCPGAAARRRPPVPGAGAVPHDPRAAAADGRPARRRRRVALGPGPSARAAARRPRRRAGPGPVGPGRRRAARGAARGGPPVARARHRRRAARPRARLAAGLRGRPRGAAPAGSGRATAELLAVAFPSGWPPRLRAGADLPALHAPVADGERLRAASGALTEALLTKGRTSSTCGGWTRTAGSTATRPPPTPHRTAVPPPEQWWLRVERQTVLAAAAPRPRAVPHPAAPGAADVPVRGAARHAVRGAVASMSDQALAYKGLGEVRDDLLAWLAG